MWALPGPHLGSSSPARRASSPTRRRRPPSRPWRRGSRRALRGIRPSGAVRLYADRAFLIPASRGPRSFASAALAERAETLDFAVQGAGFETRPPFLPFWARFCRYFWLFLAISGLGASPGGPGSKLIILRATGESQETVLLALRRDEKRPACPRRACSVAWDAAWLSGRRPVTAGDGGAAR